ncbi:MAG: hypothetical protein AAB334_00980 [Patescibacteria group bacterium]
MNTKNQIIGIIVLLILLAVMFIIRGDEDTWICEENGWVKHGNPSAPIPTEQCGEQVFCTTEAKLCPDGSGVGRVGPNCEFAPCPE